MNTVNIREFHAVGDGTADDTNAIQKALDCGSGTVVIPRGDYRITGTLLVSSHTRIEADPDARIFSCGDTPKKQGDFLLSNRDTEHGNTNIVIHGGVWDGNNQGKYNTKNPDLFAPDAWSGTVLNFFNVTNLILEDLIVANSVVFYTRFGKIDNFVIRNIGFRSEKPGFNQDGLHFSGYVRNGLIENVSALTPGQTTDDMLALNADDSLERLENRGLLRGPIENLTFRNIYAENCYTAIRMLSVTAPIRNIRFENIKAGCRCFAINMDAARYCMTPLFDEKDYPEGVGKISNIVIDGMEVWKSGECSLPLIRNESNSENITVRNFKRINELDTQPDVPTIQSRFVKKNGSSFAEVFEKWGCCKT
ncbi:MAG: endopolygalacturonase [Lentisphaeria bacterium]|nr:endopolygalacturonase [Lentisphaeria bacterium]